MTWVIVPNLAILGGKITKIRPLNSSSLPNVQGLPIIQYKFWFIRRILQIDVFITNKNYSYVAVWFILITFYHAEHISLENRCRGNNSWLFVNTNHHFGVHYYSNCLYISRIWHHAFLKQYWPFWNRLKLLKLFNYLEKKKQQNFVISGTGLIITHYLVSKMVKFYVNSE